MCEVVNNQQEIKFWLEAIKVSLGPFSALIAVWLSNIFIRKRNVEDNIHKANQNSYDVHRKKKEYLYSSLLIYEKMFKRNHFYKSLVYQKRPISDKVLPFYTKSIETMSSREVHIAMIIDLYFKGKLSFVYDNFKRTDDELNKIMKKFEEYEIFPVSRDKYKEYIDMYEKHLESIKELKTEIANIKIDYDI